MPGEVAVLLPGLAGQVGEGIIWSAVSGGPRMVWPVAAAAAAMPSGVTSQPSGFGRDRSQPAENLNPVLSAAREVSPHRGEG